MRFLQVDVFTDFPYGGNPLAVVPDAGDLTADQMGRIASEMNLSETSFVTKADGSSYEVRIFIHRRRSLSPDIPRSVPHGSYAMRACLLGIV